MIKLIWLLLILAVSTYPLHIGKASGQEGSSGTDKIDITIKPTATFLCNNAFDPPQITIPVGTTIQWKNNDLTNHRITSSSRADCRNSGILPEADRELDSGLLPFEGTYRHTFMVAGTYYYVCAVEGHTMLGSIVVTPDPPLDGPPQPSPHLDR